MIRLPAYKTGKTFNIKIDREELTLFLYINISMIQVFTARIGRLTSNQELASSILSQFILGGFVLCWCKDKVVKRISLLIPVMTILIFMLSVFIYPDRKDLILSCENGLWSVISVGGSMTGFFIVVNLKDYTKLEKVMGISLWYQVPYLLYICIRAKKVGYWIVKVGNDVFESSYNMEIGYKMSLVAVLLVYAFYKSRKLILLILSILFEVLIILFGSRGAMLPLIVYLIMWFFIGKGDNKRREVGKKLVIVAICGIVMFFVICNIGTISRSVNDFFLRKINYYSRTLMRFINGDMGNSTSRINLWKPILKALRDNIYLPLGLYADRELVGTYSHNFIIEIVSNFGMFGLGAILYLCFQTVKFFTTCKDEKEKMFLSVFISYSVSRLMLSSSFWAEQYFWIYLALLMIGICNYRIGNKVRYGMSADDTGIVQRST